MNRETATELADWLAQQAKVAEMTMDRDAPFMKAHIARLALWEKMVREIAGNDRLLEEIELGFRGEPS